MRVISRRKIIEAEAKYPARATALRGWYQVMNAELFDNFADVRQVFNSVDKVGNLYVFNVAGNHLRVIAAMHFNTQRVYIRHILTHTEYDSGKWKE